MGRFSTTRRCTRRGLGKKLRLIMLLTILCFAFCAASPTRAQQKPVVMRVGYFPNITHAQALVGRAGGQFEKAVGPGVQIEWKAFNAGPYAIEAMFANAVDLT